METEHWKLNKDGSLAGVYAVDPAKGKYGYLDVWDNIDDAIRQWTKLHPLEMAEHLLAVEYERQIQANEFGSNKGKNLRHGCSVPIGLGRLIELIDPEVFTDKKKLHKFLKKFPAFNVCQRI